MFPMPYVQREAEAIVRSISEACSRVEIVGELRRAQSHVYDRVVIMAAPLYRRPDEFLSLGPENLLDVRLQELRDSKKLFASEVGHAPAGTYQLVSPTGLRVKIVSIFPPTQWGVAQIALTGPDDHFRALVTSARERGYDFSDGAILSPAGERPPLSTEREFYQVAGMPYVSPASRS